MLSNNSKYSDANARANREIYYRKQEVSNKRRERDRKPKAVRVAF